MYTKNNNESIFAVRWNAQPEESFPLQRPQGQIPLGIQRGARLPWNPSALSW